MKIILLPGMDGTGSLFKEFIAYLGSNVSIINYETDQKQSYSELVKLVSSQMQTDEEYFLVAESFSGPIAYELLKIKTNIISVVFVASFITPPNKGLLVTKFLPSWLIITKMPYFVAKLLLGSMASNEVVKVFQNAVKGVSNSVLRNRIREMANLNIELQETKTRCSYIRPRNDTLVSNECVNVIKDQCSNFLEYEVDGSHFVLQVNPKETAKVVNREINLITNKVRL